jgi:hypothetical protein
VRAEEAEAEAPVVTALLPILAAALLSRFWSGHFADTRGAKLAVVTGPPAHARESPFRLTTRETPMPTSRTLGSQGLTVPSPGLGLMGMSQACGTAEEMAALDAGIPPEKVAGPRYHEKQMAQVDR